MCHTFFCMNRCNPDLVTYLFEIIVPRYEAFDKGHREAHVLQVVSGSMELADQHHLDLNMALTIAVYHDLGLTDGREFHHIRSGELLLADQNLKQWFNAE